MGAVASLARRQAKRPLKNYNVEERAMKIISKDKPTPAPPHPSMKKVMEDIMKDPSVMKSNRTDPNLLQNLSKVFITSKGTNPEIVASRNLPMDRSNPDEPIFGYEDPKVVPVGKASLRQLLEIITKHSEDPQNYTAEMIAKEYKLDIVDVMNILEYYKALLVYRNPNPPKAPKEKNPLKRLQAGIDNLKH